MIPLKYQLDKKLIEQIRKDERDKILEKIKTYLKDIDYKILKKEIENV